MPHKFYCLVGLCFTLCGLIHAQTIPPYKLADWKHAGMFTPKKYGDTTINFLTAGANNTGTSPNDILLKQIITNTDSGIIYFPSGIYLFDSTIVLKSNIVIKGNGNDSTIIKYSSLSQSDFITATGTYSTFQSTFLFDTNKGDSIIYITNANSLKEGDILKITQNDSTLMFSTWAYNTLGQIIYVEKVLNDTTIQIKSKLRKNYHLNDSVKVVQILPVKNVGIECLKLIRMDSTSFQTNNIHFDKVVNSWVKGIESNPAVFAHIALDESAYNEISGSWFHDGFTYGGSGRAYGVMCQFTSGDNLVYDNIFNHLRHAMLVQIGANGNVYAYNYSTDPFWSELVSNASGDIAVHGNYPYFNLFEGNIVSHIWLDNSHGLNGSYNTFFRNRAEQYGFTITNGDSTNIVGNELIKYTPIYGNWNITGIGHFLHGNNVKNSSGLYDIVPSGTSILNEASLYYSSKPPYLSQSLPWPFIGINNIANAYNNAAKDRYNSNFKTICGDTPLPIDSYVSNYDFLIYPNPTSNYIFISNDFNIFKLAEIYDLQGRLLIRSIISSSKINVQHLHEGQYIIKLIANNGNVFTKKIYKQ